MEDLADLFRANLSDAQQPDHACARRSTSRAPTSASSSCGWATRLRVRWKVDDLPVRALMPSLILQPLLENAIDHGIEPLPDGGAVTIVGSSASVNGSQIEVRTPCRRNARSGARGTRHGAGQHPRSAWSSRSRAAVAVEVDEGGDAFRVRLRFPQCWTTTAATAVTARVVQRTMRGLS